MHTLRKRLVGGKFGYILKTAGMHTRIARLPAALGDSLSQVETPALLLDMNSVEHNVSVMHRFLKQFQQKSENKARVRLRLHAKALKSEKLIRWALEKSDHGIRPVGVACQTVAEAESAFNAGCRDILLTNQLWSASKVDRLVELKMKDPGIRVGCLIDDPANVSFLANRVKASQCLQGGANSSNSLLKRLKRLIFSSTKITPDASTRLDVFIEVDVGMERCGCGNAEEVVDVAREILQFSNHLNLRGLHCYNHIRNGESGEIKHQAVSDTTVAKTRKAREALFGFLSAAERKKIFPPRSLLEIENFAHSGDDAMIITGGGTDTFMYELEGGVHNEIQPGTYLAMDANCEAEMACNREKLVLDSVGGHKNHELRFRQAVFVHGRVISSKGSRRVIDVGSKACDLLGGLPKVVAAFDKSLNEILTRSSDQESAQNRIRYELGGDEHGILHSVPNGLLPLGSTIQLVPNNCYLTVNLHRHFVCLRAKRSSRRRQDNPWSESSIPGTRGNAHAQDHLNSAVGDLREHSESFGDREFVSSNVPDDFEVEDVCAIDASGPL